MKVETTSSDTHLTVILTTESRCFKIHTAGLKKCNIIVDFFLQIRWLKIEQKLVEIDIDLKKALNFKASSLILYI